MSICPETKEKGFQPFDWKPLVLLVGAAGFELATPCTPCKYFIQHWCGLLCITSLVILVFHHFFV
jgi:hypothetical protein